MVRRFVRLLLFPLHAADWTLRRIFGDPRADESLALRNATERSEEYRRQVDRSHR